MTLAAASRLTAILDKGRDVLDAARDLLQGEPARAIGYGSALVIVGVVAVSNALGITRFGENIDIVTALGLATAAIATVGGVIESIRRFVFSAPTVGDVAAAADALGYDAAMKDAGLDDTT